MRKYARGPPFAPLLSCRTGCARNQEADTYSALKPLTCNIRICLTIVLFPDSPAPVSEKKAEGRGQRYVSARGDRCTLDPAPGEKKRKSHRLGGVSPQHFPAGFHCVTQKQHWNLRAHDRGQVRLEPSVPVFLFFFFFLN